RYVAGKNLAVVAQRLHGGETENIQRAARFIARFTEAQAGLTGDKAREFLAARFEELSGLVENGVALPAARSAVESDGGGDGGVRVLAPRQRDSCDRLAVERVLYRELFAGRNRFSRDVAREVHVLIVEFPIPNEERNAESGLRPRIPFGIRFS